VPEGFRRTPYIVAITVDPPLALAAGVAFGVVA
jgi:hypothetical protein